MFKNTIKILLLFTVLGVGVSATLDKDKLFEISKNIEIFINVFKEVNANYVDELDPSELMRTGIDAMVKSLDPYTNYISETQVERYRISDDSKYQGVGAKFVSLENKVFIKDPMEGGPAHDAGLRAGDELIEVNGVAVNGLSIEEIENQVRGAEGTPIRLMIKSMNTGKVDNLEMDRGEVNIPNVPYAGFVKDDIGYINLTTFTANAGANISKELKTLKKDNPNISGVIIDLRYNGGGLLREAIAICNLFVEKDTEVVFTKGKVKDKDRSFSTMAAPVDVDIPIAVLINGRSASASEIVSGVIQDLDRGVVIGQRSFGKGLVQNTFEIGYNSRVKVTTAKYYIPSGRCIQGVEYEDGVPVNIPDDRRSKFKTRNNRTVLDGGGVTPDIKIPAKKQSPFVKALLEQQMVFKYANKYVMKSDSITDISSFVFSDYSGFVDFVNTSSFEYKTYGEDEFKALIVSVEDTDLKADLNNTLESLKEDFEAVKQKDFDKYKPELVNELEKELISRYFYQKGLTQINLRNDNEVMKAVNVLKDQKQYDNLLNK